MTRIEQLEAMNERLWAENMALKAFIHAKAVEERRFLPEPTEPPGDFVGTAWTGAAGDYWANSRQINHEVALQIARDARHVVERPNPRPNVVETTGYEPKWSVSDEIDP